MDTPLRVLIVEDVEDEAELVIEALRSSGHVVVSQRVDTRIALEAQLVAQAWDVVIADYRLPHFNGFQALEVVRRLSGDLPFILVSGVIGEETAVNMMKAGAQDFIAKSNLVRLAPAVEREMREANGRRQQRVMEADLCMSEGRYRSLTEMSPDAIMLLDFDSKVVLANHLTASMYLLANPEVLVGFDLLDLFASHDRERAQASLCMVREGHSIDSQTFRARRADGTTFPVEVFLRLVNAQDAAATPGIMVIVRDITQRVRDAEMKTLLASIVESSDDAIIGTTLDDTIVSWNKGAEQIYGYLAAEIVGQPAAQLVPHDLAGKASYLLERLTRGENIDHFETSHRRKDDRVIDVALTISLIKDMQGRVTGISTIARDITESKLTEKRLRQAEHRFRRLLELAPDAIVTSDSAGRIVLANSQAEQVFGFRREELVGQMVDVLLPHDQQQQHARHRTDYAAKPHTRQMGRGMDLLARKKDGTEFPVEVSLSPMNSEDEMLVTAVVRDVSARKEAERALREQADLLDLAHDAIIVRDVRNSAVVFWNHGAEALYGWTAAQAQGQCTHTLLQTQLPEALEAIMVTLFADGHWAGELVHTTRDGRHIIVESRQVLRCDAQGQPRAILEINRDITDRKHAEQALAANNHDLALANAALQQANAVKADFLATMSHEIRTPMNGVIGMTGLLLDTDLTSEQRDYAESVRISGAALLTIINDILDFSKIEAGRLDLEITDFNLQHLVDDILEALAPQSQVKGVEIAAILPPTLPAMLRGDTGRLRQVLMNLIGNSVKFTPTGEVTLHVELEASTDATARLRFAVIDTGIGIAPEVCAQLFQPFQQGDGSTSRKYGGTGLGLAISKRLVELMGGKIGVESIPGQGSTFWFTLPLSIAAAAENTGTPAEFAALRGRRVLVASAMTTNRVILQNHLVAAGIDPDLADDEPTALELLHTAHEQGRPYEMVLFEHHAHDVTRPSLAQSIHDDPALASVPVVELVALSERNRAHNTMTLTKPIRRSALYHCLATALKVAPETHSNVATAAVGNARAELAPRIYQHKRVLIAEDNPINQRLLAKLLEIRGIHVDVVANGQEAIVAVAHIPYDLVFMDCQMPEIDGYAATATIRQHEAVGMRHHTPIVAMTANALVGDDQRCLAAGMDGYISKPIELHHLDAVLARWLSSSNQAEATPAVTDTTAAPTPLCDVAVMQELRKLQAQSDPGMLAELYDTFVREAAAYMTTMHTATVQADWEAVKRTAHLFKGGSAALGATALTRLCSQIETQACAADSGSVLASIESLASVFAQSQACLRDGFGLMSAA